MKRVLAQPAKPKLTRAMPGPGPKTQCPMGPRTQVYSSKDAEPKDIYELEVFKCKYSL